MGLKDESNSPIQLISQIKGHYEVNPGLALSLAITLFSFLGVPPLIGFFAKQMVLSAALDSGYIFMTLIAILTSVISAVYYLAVIKQIFFDKNEYKIYPSMVEQPNSSPSSTSDASSTSMIGVISMSGDNTTTRMSGDESTSSKSDNTTSKIISRETSRSTKTRWTTGTRLKHNVTLSSYISITISVMTLFISFFMFIPEE